MGGFDKDRARWIARHVLPHEPALRAQLARWVLPDGLDADDVVQEAYCKLASLPSVEGVRNPRSYLMMMARNAIVSHVRRSRVVSIRAVDDLDGFQIADDEPSPETQVSDRDQLQRLAVEVANLGEPSRTAFLLRFLEEKTQREIGLQLGMSEDAVQKNLRKSLKILLARLGRGGNGVDGASIECSTESRSGHGRARDERGD